ncbi:MAG: acyl carrier protein [Gemmatimonadetes bacterium]|nr:acyl carrier protein [Gemmatimonadota bacterium]MXY83214.1 acyl carrier protein [Gemmatimonadota bacterium]MYB68695.1 acyl carrier protein [Gemmatimonadota bacterium]
MDSNRLESYIVQLISEQKDTDPAQITLETRFREDLNFNSLDFIAVICGIEEKFNLLIPDEALSDIETCGDAIAKVRPFLESLTAEVEH